LNFGDLAFGRLRSGHAAGHTIGKDRDPVPAGQDAHRERTATGS